MPETKVLVVANRTASTPAMLAEVHRRRETCSFGVMVPVEGFPDGWTPKATSPAAIAGFGNY